MGDETFVEYFDSGGNSFMGTGADARKKIIMSTVKNYLSLIKFSHTIFAMPFALIGFFLGVFQVMYRLHPLVHSSEPGWHTIIYPSMNFLNYPSRMDMDGI